MHREDREDRETDTETAEGTEKDSSERKGVCVERQREREREREREIGRTHLLILAVLAHGSLLPARRLRRCDSTQHPALHENKELHPHPTHRPA